MTFKEWQWTKGMLGYVARAAYAAGYAAGKIGSANQAVEAPEVFAMSKKSELIAKKALEQFTSGKKGR